MLEIFSRVQLCMNEMCMLLSNYLCVAKFRCSWLVNLFFFLIEYSCIFLCPFLILKGALVMFLQPFHMVQSRSKILWNILWGCCYAKWANKTLMNFSMIREKNSAWHLLSTFLPLHDLSKSCYSSSSTKQWLGFHQNQCFVYKCSFFFPSKKNATMLVTKRHLW